jgi:hypothetical protein
VSAQRSQLACARTARNAALYSNDSAVRALRGPIPRAEQTLPQSRIVNCGGVASKGRAFGNSASTFDVERRVELTLGAQERGGSRCGLSDDFSGPLRLKMMSPKV